MQSAILKSTAPSATVLIRVMVGWVFLSEGIQKFLVHRLFGSGNFRRIARNDWHLFAGICTRCSKRKTAAKTPPLGLGISNIRRSHGWVFGSDGCRRLATRKSSHRGLAYLDYSDCKRGCRAAAPSQLSLGHR